MKPADVKSTHVWNLVKKLITKILYLEMVILLGYQILDTFLQKAMLQISLKSFLCLKKLKKSFLWTQVISDLKGDKIVGTFYVKELQKQIKKSLDLKRQYIENTINYMLNGKVTVVLLD